MSSSYPQLAAAVAGRDDPRATAAILTWLGGRVVTA
jgi:hypothetical protein